MVRAVDTRDLASGIERRQLDEGMGDTFVLTNEGDVLHNSVRSTRCAKNVQGSFDIQLRLMMKTVLSSIRSCSPIWRKRPSFFTAHSSNALQISFAGWR